MMVSYTHYISFVYSVINKGNIIHMSVLCGAIKLEKWWGATVHS